MKDLKANNERRADGVYFVRSALDQTARDEHLLYLLVSDGKILRQLCSSRQYMTRKA